jgi:hypothetical protein
MLYAVCTEAVSSRADKSVHVHCVPTTVQLPMYAHASPKQVAMIIGKGTVVLQ